MEAAASKSSSVWRYFELLSHKQKTKCNLCGAELSYRGGGTSTMKKHLQFKHPFSFTNSLNESPKHVETKTKQLKLDGHFSRPIPRDRYIDITSKAAMACVRDLKPLSIFEGTGMKDFLQALNPSYKAPSHTTMRNYLLKIYDQAKGNVIEQLKQQSVSFTTDMWTSCATDGYITVTGHYINDKWEMVNMMLATREMKESHTGENIGNVLDKIRDEFEIPEVVGITTDNASNMSAACKFSGVQRVRCFSHTLQLAVNEGLALQSITNMTMHARKLTAFFSKSVLASNALAAIQTKLEKKEKGVIVDVVTRWNSTFLMIQRLHELKADIYAVLNDQDFSKHRHLILKESHWTIIEQLLPSLKILAESTELLCVEEYPTCSDVLPLTFGLIQNHLTSSEFDSGLVHDFKVKVADGLRLRMLVENGNTPFFKSIPALGSALDPRYKRLKFLTASQKEQCLQSLRDLLNDGNLTSSSSESQPKETPQIKPDPDLVCKKPKLEKHTGTLHFLMGDIIEIEDDNSQDELDLYMAEPVKLIGGNLLAWWKESALRFPLLSDLARKVLCVPATSVPSERAFSTAGLTITKQRSALDPGTADAIIFLNKNFNILSNVSVVKEAPSLPSAASVTDALEESLEPCIKNETPSLPNLNI